MKRAPASQSDREAGKASAPDLPDTGEERLRVLIVDDDRDCLNLCVLFVNRSMRADVVEVTSLEDAWDVLVQADGAFDCIVCDCNLPPDDGRNFLQRAAEAWPVVPRILMSGYLSRQESREVLVDGVAHAFVHKRDVSTSLADTIQAVVRARTPVTHDAASRAQ